MVSNETKGTKSPESFWKFILMWAVGGFIWFSIKHGFPPNREMLKAWVEFLPIGVLIGLVPVVDRLLRRFKLYRDLESKLRLNRDGRA